MIAAISLIAIMFRFLFEAVVESDIMEYLSARHTRWDVSQIPWT